MLARLYGPLGMTPNSREVELLSLRQYLLMQAGWQQKHAAIWALIRGGMGEGTYYDLYDLRPPAEDTRRQAASLERWKKRMEEEAAWFFN